MHTIQTNKNLNEIEIILNSKIDFEYKNHINSGFISTKYFGDKIKNNKYRLQKTPLVPGTYKDQNLNFNKTFNLEIRENKIILELHKNIWSSSIIYFLLFFISLILSYNNPLGIIFFLYPLFTIIGCVFHWYIDDLTYQEIIEDFTRYFHE